MTQSFTRFCRYDLLNGSGGKRILTFTDYFHDALGGDDFKDYLLVASYCSLGVRSLVDTFSEDEFDALVTMFDIISARLDIELKRGQFLDQPSYDELVSSALPYVVGNLRADQMSKFGEKLTTFMSYLNHEARVEAVDYAFWDWYSANLNEGNISYGGPGEIVSISSRLVGDGNAQILMQIRQVGSDKTYNIQQNVSDYLAVEKDYYSVGTQIAIVQRKDSGVIFGFPVDTMRYFGEIFDFERANPH